MLLEELRKEHSEKVEEGKLEGKSRECDTLLIHIAIKAESVVSHDLKFKRKQQHEKDVVEMLQSEVCELLGV